VTMATRPPKSPVSLILTPKIVGLTE
jgi:hypothetical protein